MEKINRKLEADNEKITAKFTASTCVVSDLNTTTKGLENEKMCLLTTIRLIQIQDNPFIDADISIQHVEVDLVSFMGKIYTMAQYGLFCQKRMDKTPTTRPTNNIP